MSKMLKTHFFISTFYVQSQTVPLPRPASPSYVYQYISSLWINTMQSLTRIYVNVAHKKDTLPLWDVCTHIFSDISILSRS